MNEANKLPQTVCIQPISYVHTKEILDQMEKKICSIRINNDTNQNYGIGFFCKMPFSDSNKETPVLITNNTFLSNNFLKQNEKKIVIHIKSEEKPIILDLNTREIIHKKEYKIIIIELKPEDGIKDYLEFDENLIKNEKNKNYVNKSIYMLHSIRGDPYISYGLLNGVDNLNNNIFYHTCQSIESYSGFPIFNLSNSKIIGIHYPSEQNCQQGFFLNCLNQIQKSNPFYLQENIEYYPRKKKRTNTGVDDDNIKFAYDIDLSDKKGFVNFGSEQSSQLNAIIQMLTSIKDLRDEMISKDNMINKFNHIYILSSFFNKAFKDANEKKEEGNPSLREMDIVIKYLTQEIPINNIYDYLLFILKQLHDELTFNPDNSQNKENLISASSIFDEMNNSHSSFFGYYNSNYCKSIISNLFNWVRRTKRICVNCRELFYSFQTQPMIKFDLDYQQSSFTSPNGLNLEEFFDIYSKNNYPINNNQECCPKCHQFCGFSSYYGLQTTPEYFIIVINRINAIYLYYQEFLDIPMDTEFNIHFNRYKLFGVIMKENMSYSFVIKNCEEDLKGKKIETWLKFQDENIINIKFEQNSNNFEQKHQIFDPINAEVLIYKKIGHN